jgi:hypothetical protein
MFSKLFWKDAGERAVKTFAQALLALLLVAPNTPVIGFDWPTLLFTAATSGVISILTSIVGGAATANVPTVSPASLAKDDRGVVE